MKVGQMEQMTAAGLASLSVARSVARMESSKAELTVDRMAGTTAVLKVAKRVQQRADQKGFHLGTKLAVVKAVHWAGHSAPTMVGWMVGRKDDLTVDLWGYPKVAQMAASLVDQLAALMAVQLVDHWAGSMAALWVA